MNFLKAQLARIQQQLSGLSATQKMLTATLVAIMVMTLIWWARYAGEPVMEPVLNQSLSQDDVAQITNHLQAKGIPYNVVGDRVLVPADRKMEVLAELSYSQALPRDTTTGFSELIKQMSPWNSPSQNDALFLEAKQQTLASVIERFPGVSSAVVVIDPTNERRIGGTQIESSAMVTISTRGSPGSAKQLANAAADVISGAQAGLLRSRIRVVIDGVPFPIHDNAGDVMGGGDDFIDKIRLAETYYADKVRGQLVYIQGLMVAVTVSLNVEQVHKLDHNPDAKGSVSLPTETHEHAEESTSPSSGGEAGAVSNVGGLSVGGSSGGGGSTITDNVNQFHVDVKHTDIETNHPPGDAKPVAAAVRVPLSYFKNSYKIANGGKEPDEDSLKKWTAAEELQIKQDVLKSTAIAFEDAVTVGEYSDTITLPAAIAPGVATSPIATLALTSHVKEIGIGALALVSLFMVSMMVRKGGVAPALAGGGRIDEPTQHLDAGGEVAGEVGEGNAMLDGMELDDESVRAQQMVEQVEKMVGENPDAAANLVKRWLNRT